MATVTRSATRVSTCQPWNKNLNDADTTNDYVYIDTKVDGKPACGKIRTDRIDDYLQVLKIHLPIGPTVNYKVESDIITLDCTKHSNIGKTTVALYLATGVVTVQGKANCIEKKAKQILDWYLSRDINLIPAVDSDTTVVKRSQAPVSEYDDDSDEYENDEFDKNDEGNKSEVDLIQAIHNLENAANINRELQAAQMSRAPSELSFKDALAPEDITTGDISGIANEVENTRYHLLSKQAQDSQEAIANMRGALEESNRKNIECNNMLNLLRNENSELKDHIKLIKTQSKKEITDKEKKIRALETQNRTQMEIIQVLQEENAKAVKHLDKKTITVTESRMDERVKILEAQMTKHTREIEMLLRIAPTKHTESVPTVPIQRKSQAVDKNLHTNLEQRKLEIPDIRLGKDVQAVEHIPHFRNQSGLNAQDYGNEEDDWRPNHGSLPATQEIRASAAQHQRQDYRSSYKSNIENPREGWAPRMDDGIQGRVCKFHITGQCDKGGNCEFAHPIPQAYSDNKTPRSVICFKFNTQSGCNRMNCQYLHRKSFNQPCKFYYESKCMMGEFCRRVHSLKKFASPDANIANTLSPREGNNVRIQEAENWKLSMSSMLDTKMMALEDRLRHESFNQARLQIPQQQISQGLASTAIPQNYQYLKATAAPQTTQPSLLPMMYPLQSTSTVAPQYQGYQGI